MHEYLKAPELTYKFMHIEASFAYGSYGSYGSYGFEKRGWERSIIIICALTSTALDTTGHLG